MQDSKINSTLKVGILMRQVEGDKNYITSAPHSFHLEELMLRLHQTSLKIGHGIRRHSRHSTARAWRN